MIFQYDLEPVPADINRFQNHTGNILSIGAMDAF